MALDVKICGIKTPDALDAAVSGGAALVGLNFFARSPRSVGFDVAASLARRMPEGVLKVGLFVDPDDAFLEAALARVPLDLLQLHGHEPPARLAALRARFGRPLMKAIPIAGAEDLAAAEAYLPVADRLLFDAKPPKGRADALPGGNAVAFDWRLMAGRSWPRPWLLAGGLTAENLKEAAQVSGARGLDVSSGVETAPGVKDPAKIARFLEIARGL